MNVGPASPLRSVIGTLTVLLLLTASCADPSDGAEDVVDVVDAVDPVFLTDSVGDDADDPALWLDPADPCAGLIIGTNKVPAPRGAVVAFDLEGRILQTVAGVDRPNNVDVEYDWRSGGVRSDIAVVTERLASRVRVFEIVDGDQPLVDIGSFEVFEGESGQRAEPMGIATYRRPSDGAVFVIVGPKEGGADDHLWQYRLERDDAGEVSASLVRRFGHRGDGVSLPSDGEVEAIAVDDELGYVYYADEQLGLRKWWADPDHPEASTELAVFGRTGYDGDREGLAIYPGEDDGGYIVSVDQTPGVSTLVLYPRAGSGDDPHEHRPVSSVRIVADTTDGIEATSSPLLGLPTGAVIAMDSERRAFAVFDWRSLMGPAAGDGAASPECADTR